MQTLTDKLQYLYGQVNAAHREYIAEAIVEIERLNKWADRFSDSQSAECAACEALLKARHEEVERLQKLLRSSQLKLDYLERLIVNLSIAGRGIK